MKAAKAQGINPSNGYDRAVMRGYEGVARVVGLSGEYRGEPAAELSVAAD